MSSRDDLAEWAAALGHHGARVVPNASGQRFYGECMCGYKSTTRTSERLAVDALIHHISKAVREARAQGWQPPAETPSSRKDTPDRVKVSRSA